MYFPGFSQFRYAYVNKSMLVSQQFVKFRRSPYFSFRIYRLMFISLQALMGFIPEC